LIWKVANDLYKGSPVFTGSWLEQQTISEGGFELEFAKEMLRIAIAGFLMAPDILKDHIQICANSKDKDEALKTLVAEGLKGLNIKRDRRGPCQN
jgi:hypothetical protein